MLTHGRTYYPYPFTRRIVIAAIVWLAACWSTDARAQVLFRETFGSTNAQLPTATSTADGNWTNGPTCLNGRILTNANGDSASDDGTGSTHFLFHNTASCSYSAGQAVWRTVSPITVQPNTQYVFSYWSEIQNNVSDPVLTQVITPNAGAITVNYTYSPDWPTTTTWTYRSVTFTTAATTTSVNLRINNANAGSTGNDFGLDDIMLARPTPFAGCDATPYLAQGNPSTLYRVDTSTNPFGFPIVGANAAASYGYNAAGFNPADNYLYVIENGTNVATRVGADGTTMRLGAISGLPVASYPAGVIGTDGFWYVAEGATAVFYKINIATRTATAITANAALNTGGDFAWYNGDLYSATNNVLRKVTFTGATTATVSTVGSYTGPTAFGAMIGASNGVFGISNSGGFYQFNPATGAATLLSSTPFTSGNNDGAKCESAAFSLPADLAITKTDNQTTYTPGSNVTYTIVASNSGPFGAAGVNITDPLPTGVTTATWTCGSPTGGAVCGAASGSGALNTTANLPVGSSVTYTMTMIVPSTFTGNLVNSATIAPPNTVSDANTANNTATDTDGPSTPPPPNVATITCSSDANVFNTAYNGSGGRLTTGIDPRWQVALITTNVTAPPPGLIYANASVVTSVPFNWTPSPYGNANWIAHNAAGSHGGSVDAFYRFQFNLAPQVDPATFKLRMDFYADNSVYEVWANGTAQGIHSNYGAADPYFYGGFLSGNQASGTILGPWQSGLNEIVVHMKSAGPAQGFLAQMLPQQLCTPATITLNKTTQLAAGGPFNFTLTNTAEASGSVTTASSAAATQVDGDTGTAGVQPFNVTNFAQDVVITESSLPSGWMLTGATCTSNGTPVGLLSGNAYRIPGGEVDTSAESFVCTFENTSIAADVQITKTGPASAPVGTNATYTLTIVNNGPAPAPAVTVNDPTPAGVTFVSNAGDCTTAFPCSLGTIVPGGTRTITTTFAIPLGFNGTSLTNTATVSTSAVDVVPGNNTSSVMTAVDVSADIAVTKTVTPSSGVLVGDQVTFTVGASNNGPNTATGVVLTDVLPAGLMFVSATLSQGTYSQASGAWTIGTLLASDPPVTLQIVARVKQPGALTNTAVKTASQQPDPDTSNDSAVASINAAPSADVGVTKSVDNATPNVGDTVAFTVGTTNFGPSAVTNLVLTDLLPAGLTFVSATGAGSYDSNTGAWSVGSLAVNGSATLTLTAQVSAAGPLVNVVTRTSQTEADVNPANDQASVPLNAIPSADLQVTKGVSHATPAVGSDVTFTVTVRNNGPSPATSVTVTDPLPAGLTYVSAVPSQGSYDSTTGIWTAGALGVTQSATLSLTATVVGPAPATLTNTASATGAEPDPIASNNTGSSTITSQIVADLVITKTDGLTTAVPGQAITYTIVVSNRGPSAVIDAPVTDTFPAALIGVTWTCSATAPSVCDQANGSGPINTTVDLPPGGAATFIATGTLAPATASGSLTNTAAVAAPAGAADPDTSNNTATDVDTIVPTADVQITKSGPATVVAGTTATYTITVRNNGPSVATAVSVSDPAPTGLTFASATAPCAGGVTPCALGDIAVGASVSFQVTFNVPGGYTAPDPITNTATATTTATDPQPANNTALAQTALAAPVTDLGVTKTNGTATVVPGTTTVYTIVVTNAGPSNATNAPVIDTLDPVKVNVAGVTWSCAATGTASCGAAGGVGNISTTVSIAADVTGLINFVTFTLNVPVRADATGVLVNTVTVNAGPGQSDPNTTNDTDTDTLTPQADLAITKSGPSTATPGTTVTYTILVTNNGPSNADGVSVADPTPAGLAFVSNTGDCTTPFPCALGLVAAGTTRTITATYSVPASYTAPDPIVNTATVSSGTPDSNPANNSASASSTAGASADVQITKTAPPVIVPGTTASYTLTVVNNGPSVAQNVAVDETVPAGLTLSGVDGPCASFPCSIASLGVGVPVIFTVRFTVPPTYTAPNPVQNTATVTSSTSDTNAANNTSSTSTPLGPAIADLSVDKSGPSTVAPGGSITYTVIVRNAGPSAVSDGVLTDVLPAGITFASLTPPASGTCTGGSTVSCSGLVLPVGGSIMLSITGAVAPDLEIGASVTNVVTITSPSTLDPAPDNNRDQVDSRVGAATDADVAITKSDAVDPVTVGDPVTYTLTVTNDGPAIATNVTITDPLPASLTLNAVSGACAALPCSLPSLAAGASAIVTITAIANAPGVALNTATVGANEPDPAPANNTATEPTTVAASQTDADLAIVKSGPARAGVGAPILYTIIVTNRGPALANAVQVEDTVPAGLIITGAAPAQGTCTIGASITCALGSIPAGSPVAISIFATASTAGPLTNVATVTSPSPDPDPSNNTSTVTTDVDDPNAADLVITKVDSPDAVAGGMPLQYVLTVTNRGPGVATAASLSDPLPAGVTASTASSSVGSCTTGTTVTCNLGDLAPGAIVTIAIGTTAPLTVPAPNPMLNTASTTSGAVDPDPSNNSATEPTTVVTRADLAIVKTTAQANAAPGSMLTYSITVTNHGPSTADTVVITDPAPAGLSLVTAGAPCAGGFPCALGTMAPGATVTFATTYQVPASYTTPDPIVNTAAVGSSTPDTNPANNSSTVSTPAGPAQADLTIVKTGPPTVQRGGRATYTLTVTNQGPADATGVVLNDSTPAGVTFISASAPCAGGFPCTLGTLAFGASLSVTVTFEVPVSYAGPPAITNVATITSPTSDPDPDDNTSTVTTPLVEVADIQVTKTVDRATPAVGEEVTFTVTARNAGPSNATGVAITDAMPAALQFIAATPSQGTYDGASGLWTVGALANGASATLQLRVRVTAGGPQTNIATKTAGDQLDPDPSNNSGAAALTPALVSDVQIAKTADVTTVTVGSSVSFTVTARNAGPGAATNVQIVENLPAGMTLVSATPSAGSFDPATRVWTLSTLANGASATLTVVATVDAAGPLMNTARKVGQREEDPNETNDASGSTINGQSADVQVVKTAAAAGPATVGSEVTYFITASNNGPGVATSIRVREQLPAGLAFVSASATRGAYVPQTGVWEIGTLDVAGPGATAVLELHAVIMTTDPITNVASVMRSDQPDPNPLNNGGTVTVSGAALDLAVGLTTTDDPGVVGSTVTFTLSATNVSSVTSVEPITIAVPLPDEYTYVPGTTPRWTCTLVGRTVFCQTMQSVTPGQEIIVPLRVHVDAALPWGRALFAHLTSRPDTNPRNNVAQTYIGPPPHPDPDMSVTQRVDVSGAGATRTLTYTVDVTNQGPIEAAHAVLTDVLPAGVTFVSANLPSGPCTMSGSLLTCPIGAMLPGHHVFGTIVLTASAPGVVIHTLSTSSEGHDMYPRDNQAMLMTALDAPANVDTDGDGMPDTWESLMGLSVVANDANADPDGDGASNAQEYARGTHPRGFYKQYFAEGVSSAFFATQFGTLNVSATQTAGVLVEYMQENGQIASEPRLVDPIGRFSIDPAATLGTGNHTYSAVIESDQPIAADRTVSWGTPSYGAHAEAGVTAPSSTWYFAEGATGPFALFYLLQNPNAVAANITMQFLLTEGSPVTVPLTVAPFSRSTLPVNSLPALATGSMSTRITSDQPIVAERAMYFGPGFLGGTDSAGASAPSTSWFFAEGATGSFFEEFILIANPRTDPAKITAVFARPDGQTVTRAYTVAAQSRFTILVDDVDPLIAATSVAVTLTSTNGVPVVAERAMYWPGSVWQEGHVSLGSTVTGVEWAVPTGSAGGAQGAQTYVLIANASDSAGQAAVTLVFDDGTRVTRTVDLVGHGRYTVDVGATFAESHGRTFSVIVESLGATPVPIVVESARYWSTPDVFWASGTSELATKVR